MSKNIVIQEGGLGKQLTADKLKTNLVGGGTCLWVPEEDHRLGTKYINANGTYEAASDGYYGYSEVTVSGVGVATGKDPDTGEEVEVYRDPDTGEIVKKPLSMSIRVVTPPTFTGPYGDGAYIDFTGLTVAAYSSDGSKVRDIPFSELVFPVTVTDYDAVQSGTATIDGDTINTGTVNTETEYPSGVVWTDSFTGGHGLLTYFDRGNMVYTGVYASDEQGVSLYHRTLDGMYNLYYPLTSIYTKSGKTVYYTTTTGGDWTGTSPITPIEVLNHGEAEIAWAMVFNSSGEGGQPIPVQWMRPDGDVLETSFVVTVVDISPNNNDGN